MAHFYGIVQGSRGEATRTGTIGSGMSAIARGWDIGGQVCCYHSQEKRMDYVEFSVSGGGNASWRCKTLVRVWEDGKVEFLDARMALAYRAVSVDGEEAFV